MRPHRLALRLALSFIGVGLLWVFATDVVLYQVTNDPVLIARVETAKGWLFVASIAVLLYVVAYRAARRLDRARATTAAVIESIGDGVLLLGRDRRVLYANEAAARLLHCTSRDLVGIGREEFTRRFRVTLPDGTAVPPTRLASQRVFDEGGTLRYKCVLHPPDHPEVVIHAIAAPVVDDASRESPMVVSVMHDITNTERLESLRDTFLSVAAHALKTPVAIIAANTYLLDSADCERRVRSTIAIERQCSRLDRLVQNLLVLARARSRTLDLRLRDLDLAALARTAATALEVTSPGDHVAIEATAAPHVLGDAERLQVAIRNLLDDALRSTTDPSEVTMFIAQAGNDAEVGVRYPAQPTDSLPPPEWEDLGVARKVATTIVESHGGTVHEERSGDTATSWFRIPAAARH